LPSAATEPSLVEGMDAASIGTFGSNESIVVTASVSETTRDASSSFVPCAVWLLRLVGACHQSSRSVPPPPRFVGAAPRALPLVLAVVVTPAVVETAAVVLAGATAEPVVVVAAGAVVLAAVVLPAVAAGFVAAVVPPAVVAAPVTLVAAVVAVVLLPPQAASRRGSTNASSANDVTRPRFAPLHVERAFMIPPMIPVKIDSPVACLRTTAVSAL